VPHLNSLTYTQIWHSSFFLYLRFPNEQYMDVESRTALRCGLYRLQARTHIVTGRVISLCCHFIAFIHIIISHLSEIITDAHLTVYPHRSILFFFRFWRRLAEANAPHECLLLLLSFLSVYKLIINDHLLSTDFFFVVERG
jgi:hypothetical protein